MSSLSFWVGGSLAALGDDVGSTLLPQHFLVEVRGIPFQLFSNRCSKEVGFVEVGPSSDELNYYFFGSGGNPRDYCLGAFRWHTVTMNDNVIQA